MVYYGSPSSTRQQGLVLLMDRIAEQSSQQKTTSRTRDSHSNSSTDAAVKAPVNEEATFPASSLHKIADTLSHIIREDKMEAKAKRNIKEIIKYARETGDRVVVAEQDENMKVSAIRKAVKLDLVHMYNSLIEQTNGIQETVNATLTNTDKVVKEAEESKATALDLANKVTKVTVATDKIASELTTYRDALLTAPKQTSRVNVDPRVLSDIEHKAKQILVDIYDVEGNNTMAKSLTELIGKANGAISAMEDVDKPKEVKVLMAFKMRNQAILLTLNSREAVDWIKEPANETTFASAFTEGSHIRERVYNLVVPRVPVILDPKIDKHLWEIEEINGLDTHTLSKVQCNKPIGRRQPDQTHAYAIFSFKNPNNANAMIRDGLNICGTKVRLKSRNKSQSSALNAEGGDTLLWNARWSQMSAESVPKRTKPMHVGTKESYTVSHVPTTCTQAKIGTARNSSEDVPYMTNATQKMPCCTIHQTRTGP